MKTIELSNGKTIEMKDFKPYKVSKMEQIVLLEGVDVDAGGSAKDMKNFKIPMINTIKMQEVSILGMTNISQDELDELSDEDVKLILSEIAKISKNTINKKK